MEVTTHYRGDVGTIQLRGRFDFSGHREFLEAISAVTSTSSVKEIEINFAAVNYIDSAALGMLLVSRDKATRAGKHIVLTQATGSVKEVLDIENFGKIFSCR
jgi:anti-anti-sigma factor